MHKELSPRFADDTKRWSCDGRHGGKFPGTREVGKEMVAEEKARGDFEDIIPTIACEVEEVKLVFLTKEKTWHLM